jgi:hypothetical protein
MLFLNPSHIEAKYRAITITTAELYWIRMLVKDLAAQFLDLLSSPTHWCDNIRAMTLASNPVFHAHAKHIDIDFNSFYT